MEATNSSNRNSSLAPLFLLFIAVMTIMAIGVVVAIQLGIHAPIRHGVEAAASVSSMFNSDGSCNRGPSVEMRNKYGLWMNLCFHDDGASAWITTEKISDPSGREVTTIPREQMSKPVQYLRSKLMTDGYVRSDFIFHGNPPQWFVDILDTLTENGLLQ